MKKIKAIIIDDEQHAIDLLSKVLNLFDNSIEIISSANNLPDGILQIQSLQPELVFLDIEMPNYTGMQIKDFFPGERNFEIIYVTAHSEYAIEAIRLAAFDYLLKPIDIESLKACLLRLNPKIEARRTLQLLENKLEHTELPEKLAINTHQGTHYINTSEIYYIEASAMYSIIHLDKEQIVVSKPLKDFAFLEEHYFFRTHRSFIVNIKKVVKFLSKEGTETHLINGQIVPVSNSRKDAFKQRMLA
jgi:two-component system, LytTR family, response regulator